MYKIEISKIVPDTRREKNWQKVADSGNPRDGGAIYEYIMEDAGGEREIEMLKQVVDELDLSAVIKAINNL